ncbi:ATP-dependent DNA helicase RecQ [hydrothermal vent metagenome]|uniref:DNA 3'-5' helicase n=1 Tax=hydrothermal vent metagenome TaxID=652676 RepID=A0A3B1CD40_9ZZZZ
MNYKAILKSTFGFDEFRPLQEDIINCILNKKDSLVIMPTGGGKSLCFQIPALIFEGLTIVISPLISLMKDQVQQLTEVGINAVFLNSSLSPEDYRINEELIRNNRAKLLYVAPETLTMEKTLNLLSSVKVDCITVDEAHCISEWGHDFRPEYRQIADISLKFKDAVIAAFTATATPQVQDDIIKNLKLKNSKKFVASFNRKNLYLQIIPKFDPLSQTVEFLEKYPNQSGIIYCFSRRQVDELYEELNNRKFSVRPYHAGLSDADRKKHQEEFIRDDVQIIVATIAFGMGINKPNVRFVIHHDLPKNIESYYQEIGRAGRDGLRAHCLLLFGYGDISKINYFIDQKEDKEKRIAKLHLDALVRYAEAYNCRRIPLLNYFGEKYDQDECGMCDNCEKEEKDLVDVTTEAQKFLSCIKRTGEIFGAVHIVDVLRGSKAQKVINKNHHMLSTFGIGKDLAKEQWLNLSRQFIQHNIIEKDFEFGSLKITERGLDVLRGNLSVKGKLIEETLQYKKQPESILQYDRKLFESLRILRKRLADKSNIPPYVIFPDKTLIEMASYFPQTENALSGIHGVGEQKLKRYGKTFLAEIIKYCEVNNITEKIAAKHKTRKRSKLKSKRFLEVGEAYEQVNSFDELINKFNVKQNTIISHLATYVREGNKINPDMLLKLIDANEKKQKEVFTAFEQLGVNSLRPIFDELEETVTYDDLHILRICYMIQNYD